jgi:hypothetical protein
MPQLEVGTQKTQRGFSHPSTACLLCPRYLRDEFDTDKEGFCRSVQNGTLVISHINWPSFLYPENGYDPEAVDEHLLRGPFLLSVRVPSDIQCMLNALQCFRHIFTGACTALKATPGKEPGKKCLAELYNMTKVTPQHVSYVAVIVSVLRFQVSLLIIFVFPVSPCPQWKGIMIGSRWSIPHRHFLQECN